MRHWIKLLGPYLDEATDGTEGGAGGSAPAADAGATGTEGQQQQPQTTTDIAAGMLAAIEADHTGGTDATVQPGQGDNRPRDAQGRFIEADAAAAARVPGAAPGAGRDGSPLLDANGQPIDPNRQQQQAKKAADFALSEEEKKTLSPKAQGRFGELVETLKTKESELERLSTENGALSEARTNIMSVLTEHRIEAEDLTQFAQFNLMAKSGDLNGALTMLEAYRTQLLEALGRDAPGYDPLAKPEHADLQARVNAQQLSREDALALVNARRITLLAEQQQRQQSQQQRGQQDVQRSQDQALNEVKAWNNRIAADVDYDAKAGNIMPLLEGIIKDYPPHLWVKTLQRLWDTTSAPRAQQQQQGQQQAVQQQRSTPQPLRPSGGGGGKPVPKTMQEALEATIPHAY